MSETGTRRLAAIVMADIAGYSRLMGNNERGTHQRVQQVLRELVEPTIAEHRGRLVRQRGDGFLSMFDSPVEAVRSAIVIQQSMVGRNLELPEDQRIRFRIGINLGDVIVEPDDIYGEGVNVAARLEQLAEPGNIYISGGIYEQIRYKLVCGYQSLGDRRVKNILDPVPIYRVLPDPTAMNQAVRSRGLLISLLAAGTIMVIVSGIGGWYLLQHRATQQQAQIVATTQQTNAPGVAVVPPVSSPSAADTPPITPSEAAKPPPPVPVAPAPVVQAVVIPPPPVPPVRPAITEPAMVPIPGGTFQMGSSEDASEQPMHRVTVSPFLMAKYPVTVGQWRECVRANACGHVPPVGEDDDAPMTNTSWTDAKQFITWLAQATQQPYRLPSEAEWEYAARGATTTRYWWGNAIKPGVAVCKGCSAAVQPVKVGTLSPNPFGLYDISGGIAEWVEDCWYKDYRGAPGDGSARSGPDCRERVLRGGSWRNDASYARSASRDYYDASVRYPTHGFRIARSP